MSCDIELTGEAEGCGHWSWGARIYDNGRVKHHTVMLSFGDYDFWSHGTTKPSQVAEKALRYAFDHDERPALPPVFDLGRLRRMYPGMDEAMKGGAR